ncbi:hypothetical protein PC119_g15245 [Phytophthora cactorum]|uniref:Uncharacterized protein n=1 Tax=Phytophthora cactorum TaxID=29920 RepID=A0A8T1CHC3_9STRA|nr:hypothetical protein PC117_g16172 [Phytophthora cactorum]KAG3005601.1 hypothetical protein PC119_g15245 [Phytophthora cactorum]
MHSKRQDNRRTCLKWPLSRRVGPGKYTLLRWFSSHRIARVYPVTPKCRLVRVLRITVVRRTEWRCAGHAEPSDSRTAERVGYRECSNGFPTASQ